MNDQTPPQFVVLYRWKLKPGKERQFIDNWVSGTKALLGHGSFGSRLHKGPGGIWYAYAQWPDAQTRENAFNAREHSVEGQQMVDAIQESFPEIILEPVADFLVLPK